MRRRPRARGDDRVSDPVARARSLSSVQEAAALYAEWASTYDDDVFGELGLLSGAPRSASVIAESDGRLLVLDGPDFLSLVGSRTPLRGRLLTLYEPAPEPGR